MKPRVLVVDDEADFLDLVDFRLSAQGFEVVRAMTGLEGLRRARCEAPNVIIMDMMLPDLDGLSVCEILRAQPSTRDVPVLVVSSLDDPAAGSGRTRSNICHWLRKGSELGLLGERVRAAVNEHRRRMSARVEADEDTGG